MYQEAKNWKFPKKNESYYYAVPFQFSLALVSSKLLEKIPKLSMTSKFLEVESLKQSAHKAPNEEQTQMNKDGFHAKTNCRGQKMPQTKLTQVE